MPPGTPAARQCPLPHWLRHRVRRGTTFDSAACGQVVFSADYAGPSKYRVPYAVAGCLSVVNGLFVLVLHSRDVYSFWTAVRAAQESRSDPTEDSDEGSGDGATAEETGDAAAAAAAAPANLVTLIKQLEWELAALTRDLRRTTVSVLSALIENVPMV